MNGVNIAKRYFPELAGTPQEPVVEIASSLCVQVLGSVQLVSSGKSESIRGNKRQQFLAILLESKLSGRSEVLNLDLIDTLYPDEDELKSANNLRGLVSNLRQHLGDNAILTTTSGYTLGNVQSDAETFLQTGDTNLWRGAYLEGLNLDTGTFTDSLYLLLYEKANTSLESNPKESARVGKILLEYDPYNRDYLKLCLQALRATNNHKSLSRLYAEASERFLELGETLPENWKAFLAS
jgi:DNA-binding SARP family transcriptional activator